MVTDYGGYGINFAFCISGATPVPNFGCVWNQDTVGVPAASLASQIDGVLVLGAQHTLPLSPSLSLSLSLSVCLSDTNTCCILTNLYTAPGYSNKTECEDPGRCQEDNFAPGVTTPKNRSACAAAGGTTALTHTTVTVTLTHIRHQQTRYSRHTHTSH